MPKDLILKPGTAGNINTSARPGAIVGVTLRRVSGNLDFHLLAGSLPLHQSQGCLCHELGTYCWLATIDKSRKPHSRQPVFLMHQKPHGFHTRVLWSTLEDKGKAWRQTQPDLDKQTSSVLRLPLEQLRREFVQVVTKPQGSLLQDQAKFSSKLAIHSRESAWQASGTRFYTQSHIKCNIS